MRMSELKIGDTVDLVVPDKVDRKFAKDPYRDYRRSPKIPRKLLK